MDHVDLNLIAIVDIDPCRNQEPSFQWRSLDQFLSSCLCRLCDGLRLFLGIHLLFSFFFPVELKAICHQLHHVLPSLLPLLLLHAPLLLSHLLYQRSCFEVALIESRIYLAQLA
jgi:hypothetical protein